MIKVCHQFESLKSPRRRLMGFQALCRITNPLSCICLAVLALEHCLPLGHTQHFEADAVTEFTLHTTKATWPQAHNTCLSTGGVLLNLEDPYKSTILKDLFLLPDWSSVLSPNDYSVWVGFYDVLPPRQQFRWTNSCEIMYPNAHGYNFTNTSSDMRCGASHGDTSIWRIEDCAQRKMFVCEMRTDLSCNYTVIEHRYIIDGDALQNPNGTAEYCNSVCLPNPQCWAAYLATVLKQGCIFHLATDPSGLRGKFAFGKKLYVKDCIQDNVVSASNTSRNTSSFPDECAEVYNVTTTDSPAISTASSISSARTTIGQSSTTVPDDMPSTTSPPLSSNRMPITTEASTSKLLTEPSAAKTTSSEDPAEQLFSTTVLPPMVSKKQTTLSSTQMTIPVTESSEKGGKITVSSVGISDNSLLSTTSGIKTWIDCPCPCSNIGFLNFTDAEKQLFLHALLESLTVNKSALSSTRRRLTSANDKRPSARYIGGFGIAMMCIVGCFILAMDLDRFVQFIYDKHKWATKQG